MWKSKSAVAVLLSLVVLAATPSRVACQTETDTRLLAKVKANVAALGSGSEAKVKVKLRDGKKLKGYISYVGEEKFAITDSEPDDTKIIAYDDVAEIKRQKRLLPMRALLIGAGVAFAAVLVVGIARNGIGDL